jgi:hypothetical protein
VSTDDYREYCDSRSGVYPPDDFEGIWIEHWPQGTLKYRGEFQKNAKRVGQHICFWVNGVLDELSFWKDGWICGTVLWFRDDGSRECEKNYGEVGGKRRTWVERLYGEDSRLFTIFVWKNHEIVSEWTEPELLELEKQVDIDKIIDDAVRQVYPDD